MMFQKYTLDRLLDSANFKKQQYISVNMYTNTPVKPFLEANLYVASFKKSLTKY